MRTSRKIIVLAGTGEEDISYVLDMVQKALNELGVKVKIESGIDNYEEDKTFTIAIRLEL